MLMGRYGNTSTAPYMEAFVSFPRLGVRGLVSFLVDTGADGSILMPADSTKLGVDFSKLRNPIESRGIGGVARGFEEICVLTFSDKRYTYSYLLNHMEISARSKSSLALPSLLGRDILNKWRLVTDYRSKKIQCTPHTWHLRRKI